MQNPDMENQNGLQLYYQLKNYNQLQNKNNQIQIQEYLENLVQTEFNFSKSFRNFKQYQELGKYFKSLYSLAINFEKSVIIQNDIVENFFEGLNKLKELKALKVNIQSDSLIGYALDITIKNILRFDNLESLQLNLTSNLNNPQQLQQLKRLANLKIFHFTFHQSNSIGIMINDIGIALESLTSLTSIQLEFDVKDIQTTYIQQLIKGCSSSSSLVLFKLHLLNHFLIQEEFKLVTQFLKSQPQLQLLSLAFNIVSLLQKEEVSQFIMSISEMKQLKELIFDVNKNKYGKQIELGFWHMLQQLKLLTRLKVKILKADDGFPKKIQNSYNDSLLIIDGSQEGLHNSLNQISKLESLSLELDSIDIFGTGGVKNFGENIIPLGNLTELKFSLQNQMEYCNEAIQSLRNAFKEMKQIQKISFQIISKNVTNFEGLEELCEGLNELINLEYLELIFNFLIMNSKGGIVIGQTLQKLSNLSQLALKFKNSNLGQKNIESLYQTLKNLKNLKSIQLDINDIFSTIFIQLIQDLNLINFQLSEFIIIKKFSYNNNLSDSLVISDLSISHESKYLSCIELKGIVVSLTYIKYLTTVCISFPKTILSKQEALITAQGLAQLTYIHNIRLEFAISLKYEHEVCNIFQEYLSKIKNLYTFHFVYPQDYEFQQKLIRKNKKLVHVKIQEIYKFE